MSIIAEAFNSILTLPQQTPTAIAFWIFVAVVTIIFVYRVYTEWDEFVEYFIIHYRWIFVVLFLLPLSVIYEAFWYLRNRVVFAMRSAPKMHATRVGHVQDQVRAWNKSGRKGLMCTARPGWLTMSMYVGKYKKTGKSIEINLCDVLEVDTKRQIVRVEPLASMGQISATLLPLGWTLAVVPELDDLTVGGLVCGVGVETSSHRHGLFAETCVSFEVVLADGSLVTCSREENSELFYAIPWSHGTLGLLVSAEIRIVPAKQYVRIQYIPTHTLEEGVRAFEQASRDESNDYVEALMFNERQMVVMIGHQQDRPKQGRVNSIGRWYKPWFYTHAASFLDKVSAKPEDFVEYIPLRHYFHRHTRSIFWELNDIISFGNNPLFRYTLGWLMPPKISLLKLTTTSTVLKMYETKHVVQDMLVPLSKTAESLLTFHKEFQVYPLWLCPFKVRPPTDRRIRPFMRPNKDSDDQMFVDIGAYGNPKTSGYKAEPTMRRVEAFVRKINGVQMLYADSYQSREEFREMFDHSMYDALRKKYNCDGAFPEVYDKVSRQARRYKS